MSRVHIDSSGDTLARGMSWPVGATAVEAAFSARAEPQIWLTLWRTDSAKLWAGVGARERAETELLHAEYTGRHVINRVDSLKRSGFSRKPDWFGMDDPPLCWVSVYSLPAKVLKAASLTRGRIADIFADAMKRLAPRPITKVDWRIQLVLHIRDSSLNVRFFRCPVRKWELESELVINLADSEVTLK